MMNRFASLPGPARAAFWMTSQCAVFAAALAGVRALSPAMSAYEITFFRGLIGLMILTPWLLRSGPGGLRPPRPGFVALRNLLLVAAVVLWFLAAGMMPISDAVAVQFTLPLLTVLGAGMLLGERVGLRRWLVVGAGFVGALVIIRPGYVEVSPAVILVLISALIYAVVHLMTKVISSHISGSLLAFHMNLMMTAAALVLTLLFSDWVMPSWAEVPWLLMIGVASTAAHLFMIRAYRAADASFVESFDFMRLPFAALFGWLTFGETSDAWTWMGAAIIFASVSYNTRFEARAANHGKP